MDHLSLRTGILFLGGAAIILTAVMIGWLKMSTSEQGLKNTTLEHGQLAEFSTWAFTRWDLFA